MNFQEAMDYISEINGYGSVLGLENMRLLMNMLGNPQNDLPVIHIAGTNGKGSVGAFISAVLTDAGYSVGRYVSPTVMDYLERFQINDEYMPCDEFAECLEKVKKCADEIWEKNKVRVTAFEVETAVAFYWFFMKKCDAVLLEVGLGGRLDATNVINNSLLSVITSVSYDHTNVLGSTLYDIAKEKAGIIKENGTVLTLNQDKDVIKAISEECREKNAELIHVSERPENVSADGKTQKFYAEGYGEIRLSLMGKFQTENAYTALKACEFLNKTNAFDITPENIKNGIYNAQWTGRFYRVSEKPLFITDGAHNADAVEKLIESLDLCFENKSFIFIIGVFKDKDYRKMTELCSAKARKIYAVNVPNPRGLDNTVLKTEIEKYNKNVYAMPLYEAIKSSMDEAGENDVILAFGSLSYLGDTIRYVKNMTLRQGNFNEKNNGNSKK